MFTDNALVQDGKSSSSMCREENVGDDEVNIRLFRTQGAVIWLGALGLRRESCLEKTDIFFQSNNNMVLSTQ